MCVRAERERLAMAGFIFSVMKYFFVFLWSFVTLLRVLFVILRYPLTVFKKTPRDVPPACLQDPSLGTHEYVTANGLRFHCVTSGDRSKPLMLFLHGFPEFWFSWRYQIREFSKDYRVVAIDLRGYGDTDRPGNKMDYTIENLKQDAIELISALGYTTCTMVGHDWGGVIAWRVANRRPELIDKLVIMNCPHPKVFGKQLSKGWGQLMKSWYIFMFQMPCLPEFVMGLRDYRMFGALYRGSKAGVRNKAAFPPDVLEAYKYTFSKPGALTGPINYIRCIFSQGGTKLLNTQPTPIEVPTLIIWGDDDNFLEKEMADAHGPYVSNLTVRHIPNCSHWVQQDAPDLTNRYMRDFLEEESQ